MFDHLKVIKTANQGKAAKAEKDKKNMYPYAFHF